MRLILVIALTTVAVWTAVNGSPTLIIPEEALFATGDDRLRYYRAAVQHLRDRLWKADCDVRVYNQHCIFSPATCKKRGKPVLLRGPCENRPLKPIRNFLIKMFG